MGVWQAMWLKHQTTEEHNESIVVLNVECSNLPSGPCREACCRYLLSLSPSGGLAAHANAQHLHVPCLVRSSR